MKISERTVKRLGEIITGDKGISWVSYDVNVLLEYIQKNTRVASVRAAMEEAREAV